MCIRDSLYIDPDEDTLNRLKEKKRREEEKRKGLSYLIGKESRTIDGRELDIFANITEPLDIEQVLRSDAAGIGLMRSEFLYLKRDDLPSEEEQINAYREVIRRMDGRITIIRTLDFGARKMIDMSRRHPDANPALGFRSIRICLAMPEMFCTQLRAIYRAACYGPVGIQFPMVDSVETVSYTHLDVYKRQRFDRMEKVSYSDIQIKCIPEEEVFVLRKILLSCPTLRNELEQAVKESGFSDPILFLPR